jgi:NADP-dependent 3-hydroxy acid dehydrogenase YdfG
VNVSSAAAADGFPLLAAYSASKAAIAALSLALRREVKDRRIRVATVRIHHVMSEFLGAHSAEDIGSAAQLWMREGLLSMTPLMSPARVAEAIAFLVGLPPDASVHDIDIRAVGS